MNKILLHTRSVVTVIAIVFALLITTNHTAWASPNTDLVSLQILTINDFHGALVENAKNPGLAKVAQYLQDMKAKNPHGTLILSGGDMFQGSPDSNLLYGKTVVEAFNNIGFDATAIGNHEFDWGVNILKDRIAQSKFQYLAANIIENSTGKAPLWAKPYTFFERNGVKIAIIGMSTPETSYKSSAKITSPYTFADPTKIATTLIPELKQQVADIIIVLSHMSSFMDKNTGEISGEAADFALNTHNIDAIISAHSHQIVHGTVNNVPIIQAGNFGRAVGNINILFKKSTKEVIFASTNTTQLPFAGLKEKPAVTAIIAKAQTEIAPIKNLVLATTTQELSHDREAQQLSLLGEFTADVMREAANADIAFQNAGGIRTSIAAGNITMGNLYEVFPFDNTLFTVEMTGAQIMKVLQHGIMNNNIGMVQFSGLKVFYDEAQPDGQRITATLTNGQPLELTKSYKVVTNDFMATGGDNFTMFKDGKNQIDTYIPLRDTFAAALKKQKTIDCKDDNRFIRSKAFVKTLLPAAA